MGKFSILSLPETESLYGNTLKLNKQKRPVKNKDYVNKTFI